MLCASCTRPLSGPALAGPAFTLPRSRLAITIPPQQAPARLLCTCTSRLCAGSGRGDRPGQEQSWCVVGRCPVRSSGLLGSPMLSRSPPGLPLPSSGCRMQSQGDALHDRARSCSAQHAPACRRRCCPARRSPLRPPGLPLLPAQPAGLHHAHVPHSADMPRDAGRPRLPHHRGGGTQAGDPAAAAARPDVARQPATAMGHCVVSIRLFHAINCQHACHTALPRARAARRNQIVPYQTHSATVSVCCRRSATPA